MPNSKQKHQSNFQTRLFALSLERSASAPLHAQLTDHLREMIRSGTAPGGVRLPASRTLAAELSVSRITVQTAFDQLLAEGYLTTRRGAGTYVAEDLPHLAPPPLAPSRAPDLPPPFRPFQPGVPDTGLFPWRDWARHLERAWQRPHPSLLGKGDPLGWPPLRAEIASHLSAWRGIPCRAEQVVITSGASEAFDLVFQACLHPGARVGMEDPGYAPLRRILADRGYVTVPHRVDAAGLDPDSLDPRLDGLIITPSRHFPTGVTLPLKRRLALLDWASARQAPLIEDDYDGEFRYKGQPLPAMASLDRDGHVFYLGSFSKLLTTSLRLGYLVVPERWLPAIRALFVHRNPTASLVAQPALAEFMASGAFATHLRRMRRHYARRQARLVAALSHIPELITVPDDPAGMHLCCGLGPALAGRVSDTDLSQMGAAQGLSLRALSSHSVLPEPPQGLVLGYAAYDEAALEQASTALVRLLRQAQPGSAPVRT